MKKYNQILVIHVRSCSARSLFMQSVRSQDAPYCAFAPPHLKNHRFAAQFFFATKIKDKQKKITSMTLKSLIAAQIENNKETLVLTWSLALSFLPFPTTSVYILLCEFVSICTHICFVFVCFLTMMCICQDVRKCHGEKWYFCHFIKGGWVFVFLLHMI